MLFDVRLCTLCLCVVFVQSSNYEAGVIFTVYVRNETFTWNHNTNLTTHGCSNNEKFAFIVHGWEGSDSAWIEELARKLLKYRGGCVITLNWGKYSDDINYEAVVLFHWKPVSKVLLGKLRQLETEGVSSDNIFMYGHSLGARMVVDAGIAFGKGKISQIDACDSAGPNFLLTDLFVNPKNAAKNVQCIHTSVGVGTNFYNCHQDWLMGYCGALQPATEPVLWFLQLIGLYRTNEEPEISHDLCNEFYLSAFENNFTANNYYGCRGVLNEKLLPRGYRMGYMETRRNPSIVGRIASPTSRNPPYNGV